MDRNRGFTLIELMIVIAVIAIIAAIAIPSLLSSQMASNERNSHASLKTLITAEIDFRSNDRDGNRIQDFWTADVAGLYCMTSASTTGNADSPLRLIDISVASADTDPLADGAAGGEYRAISNFGVQSPKAGYWYSVLDMNAETGNDYQLDTGGLPDMGSVHNLSFFGAITYPDEATRSGRNCAIINQEGSIFIRNLDISIKPSTTNPPGPLTHPEFKDWPTTADLSALWANMD